MGHMVTVCLTIWGNTRLFSTVHVPFYMTASNVCGFLFLHISTHICCCVFFYYYSYPSGCKVISHCSFDLNFPDVEHSFMWLLGHVFSSLERCLLRPLPIFNQVVFFLLSCRSSLYILYTRPLLDIYDLQKFSPMQWVTFSFSWEYHLLKFSLNISAILLIFWVRNLIKVPSDGNTHTYPITTITTISPSSSSAAAARSNYKVFTSYVFSPEIFVDCCEFTM